MSNKLKRPGIKSDGSFECDGCCALMDNNGIYPFPMENCPGYYWCKELSRKPQKIIYNGK